MSSDTSLLSLRLSAALAAAARGWRVFPLRPDDKRPALHGIARCHRRGSCAQGHQGWERRATNDTDRIRRCWSTAPFNVGVATGPSGLVVIDLDIPKKDSASEYQHTGTDEFLRLLQLEGDSAAASTYTVATGRGGRHLYYLHPPGPQLRNTTGGTRGSLGHLVDTRAHGGYVVAAGSAVNGKHYVATDPDMAAAPLPPWLASRLQPSLPPLPKAPVLSLPEGRRRRYLQAAVDAELTRVVDSPPHGHNNALYLAAVALGQLVAGGALRESEVTSWLVAAAADVGQGFGEAHRTIRSGLRAGTRRPRSVAA